MVNNIIVVLRKSFFVILMIFCFGQKSEAQIIINEEASIIKLMEVYKNKNAQMPIVRAWRIQIMTTSDRMEMEKTNKKFESLYPDMEYSWEHNPPYYQVRVGAYERKADLEAILLEIKKEFPLSIPVQDDIAKKDLVNF